MNFSLAALVRKDEQFSDQEVPEDAETRANALTRLKIYKGAIDMALKAAEGHEDDLEWDYDSARETQEFVQGIFQKYQAATGVNDEGEPASEQAAAAE